MKVLFVSGKKIDGHLSPIIKNQTNSLRNIGLKVDNYSVENKGFYGYLKEISVLRKHLRQHKYDLIHAHYAYSGFLVALATRLPIVVSLMGGEAYQNLYWIPIIKIFSALRWNAVIVKSDKMRDILKIRNSYVIPNGVDLDKFKVIEKQIAKRKVNFDDSKYILFINASRYEKNYELAKNANRILDNSGVKLKLISNVSQGIMSYYLNAADILLLTSNFEGSPNVIKEAMACNLPIVSVDVGDVKEVIGETNGCYIAKRNPEDIATKLSNALLFGNRTNGRNVIEQVLDQNIIAKKIITLYSKLINVK